MSPTRAARLLLGMTAMLSIVLPSADAHWAVGATPGSATTHAHFMAPGTGPSSCSDQTISSQTSIKISEHAGASFPNTIVVNDGDGNDAFYSDSALSGISSFNGLPYTPNVPEPTTPGVSGAAITRDFGGTSEGVSSTSSRTIPANFGSTRQITTAPTSTNTGTQGTYTRVPGNDMYDSSTVSPADSSGTDGVPFSSPPASRSGSINQNVVVDEGTDHDFETCAGVAEFTYAIDDGAIGMGAPHDVGNNGCNVYYCIDGALSTNPDGCQNPIISGSIHSGCAGTAGAAEAWCGAGQDLNDPVRPAGDTSLLLAPETPFGQIGNDGVFDYVGADGACTATQIGTTNQPPTHTQSAMINSGSRVGLANANVQGIKLAAIDQAVTDLYTINQNIAGLITVKSPIRPVMYLVCNDVTSDGCTNVPVEAVAGAGALVPMGHVAARLQLCGFDPLTQTGKVNTGSTLLTGGGPATFYGEAFDWGGRSRESLGFASRPCWPEILEYGANDGIWEPASSANDGATVWEPDQAPATPRPVETITLALEPMSEWAGGYAAAFV